MNIPAMSFRLRYFISIKNKVHWWKWYFSASQNLWFEKGNELSDLLMSITLICRMRQIHLHSECWVMVWSNERYRRRVCTDSVSLQLHCLFIIRQLSSELNTNSNWNSVTSCLSPVAHLLPFWLLQGPRFSWREGTDDRLHAALIRPMMTPGSKWEHLYRYSWSPLSCCSMNIQAFTWNMIMLGYSYMHDPDSI